MVLTFFYLHCYIIRVDDTYVLGVTLTKIYGLVGRVEKNNYSSLLKNVGIIINIMMPVVTGGNEGALMLTARIVPGEDSGLSTEWAILSKSPCHLVCIIHSRCIM